EDGIRDPIVTGVQTCALPISQAMVRACSDRLQLALELAPAAEAVEGERAVVHRTEHGAPWLACVRAVAEAACRRERLDVVECGEIGRASCRERVMMALCAISG